MFCNHAHSHTHTRNAFHVYCIAFWCSRRPVVGICTYRLSARTIVSRPRPLLGRFLWLLPGLPFRHLNANGHWTCLWISGCVFVSLLCHTNVGSLFSQCRHFIICFSSFILQPHSPLMFHCEFGSGNIYSTNKQIYHLYYFPGIIRKEIVNYNLGLYEFFIIFGCTTRMKILFEKLSRVGNQ